MDHNQAVPSTRPSAADADLANPVFRVHVGGKISVQSSMEIKNREMLSKVYTPGVAQVCTSIHHNPQHVHSLTMKSNTVAVVSDGTAVLGLGDIGPAAALPVMEGKAMLFKQLADINAFPLCLNTQDTEEIIFIVKAVSPVFGGINLEDISAPRCFEIEKRLVEELDIPVFHDDQHGTAIVVLAGLINAIKVVDKRMEDLRVVVNGIGAAGVSICKLLIKAGVGRIIPVDRHGAIVQGGAYENPMWQWLADQPQTGQEPGSLKELIHGVDVFIGVSKGGLLKGEDLQRMNPDAIVFALANPEPEIMLSEALPYVSVYASGRSDFPNQINNVLAFPGIFRGALDCRAKIVNDAMKMAAAHAIADSVSDAERSAQYIIPDIFNEQIVPNVRKAVILAAAETGAALEIPDDIRIADGQEV
ncbi:NAD-dependent malic enzyme [compost metagenome]